MAIDRGPWNALVDDDGSNLVGSIWNKAAIKTVILDPTDAAIAPYGVWLAEPFNAAHYTGLTITAGQVNRNRYARIGKTLIWNLGIDNATVVGAPTQIGLTLPGGAVAGAISKTIVQILAAGAWASGVFGVNAAGSASCAVTRMDFSAFVAGAFYLSVTTIIEVQ